MTVTKPSISLVVATGDTMEFSGTDIMSATVTLEQNPISAELPISTIECQILSYDDTFSMFAGARYNLLSERLPLSVYETVDDVTQFVGKFYLSAWKNVNDYQFLFSGIDILGVLDATDFYGAFWDTPATLDSVLDLILTPINVVYNLDSALVGVSLRGWIPPGNCREALQHVLFAAGAKVATWKNGDLDITQLILPYDDKISDPDGGFILDPDGGFILDPDGMSMTALTIADSAKWRDQPLDLLPIVTSIELVSHNYSIGTVMDTIFNQTLDAGSHRIIFEKPYYTPSLVITGPGYAPSLLVTENDVGIVTENGDDIEAGGEYDLGPNSLLLTMDAPGAVTITGYSWIDSKKSFTFYETGLTEFKNKNALLVSDATMVNMVNADDVLQRLAQFYRLRYLQSMRILPSTIQPGDLVLTSTLYQKQLLATVIKMTMDLTGGFISATDVLGIEFTG